MPAADVNITANFELVYYQLTLVADPPAGGSVTGQGTYIENQVADISASPNQGFQFVNWTGDVQNVQNVNNPETTVTMPAQSVSITANFSFTVSGEPCPGMPAFTDPRDGTTYPTVYINEQCWLKENLKYLPEVSPANQGSDRAPHFYVHGYDGAETSEAIALANYQNYGVLYNWPAAFNACPNGWHLSSDAEWTDLTSYLINNHDHINSTNVGNILKSCRQVDSPMGGDCDTDEHPRWNYNATNFGTDEFGFSAFPGGGRQTTSLFQYLGSSGYWWNSTQTSDVDAYRRHITLGGGVARGSTSKMLGYSVRCVRDDVFGLPEYNLDIQKNIAEAGGAYGQGNYNAGRQVLLTAFANAGYFFVSWTIDGAVLSTDESFIYTMPAEAVTIIANFASALGQPCPGMPTFTDPRDGKVYNTVQIGDQCWLKENLNYDTENSLCHSNNTDYCDAYGHLYTWHEAVDICPTGWHLPSHDEWTELEQYICSYLGNTNCATAFPFNTTTTGWRGTNEGNALKSCRQVNSPLGDDCLTSEHPRWNSHSVHFGTDVFGLSGLPGGHRSSTGFWNLGTWFQAWSATPSSETHAWSRYLPHQRGDVGRNLNNKGEFQSVRCVRNE
jgi:uncharacterized protein (TIGR02145 family)